MEDYPGSLAEFEERFSTEAACLEYLARLRWPDGFVCPQCGANVAWRTSRGLWCCQHCSVQTSVTAGTIFHRTRKPLRLWFRTMWHITTQKYGSNALGLRRVVEPGCYETSWAGVHFLQTHLTKCIALNFLLNRHILRIPLPQMTYPYKQSNITQPMIFVWF